MAHTFEERDLSLLEKTMRLRERMMDNIAVRKDEELPSKPSDLMAVTNLLESIDRSILGKAKIDIEGDSKKNEEATKELLRQLVIDIHTNGSNRPAIVGEGQKTIPSYIPFKEMGVSPGELILKSDNYIDEDN